METAPSHNQEEDQVKEYESQLADVLELLQATPGDPALLSLKSDLEELISITRQSATSLLLQQQQAAGSATSLPVWPSTQPIHGGLAMSTDVLEKALAAAVETSVGGSSSSNNSGPTTVATSAAATIIASDSNPVSDYGMNGANPDEDIRKLHNGLPDEVINGIEDAPTAKRKAKVQAGSANMKEDFEIPAHLIVHDTDTEKERNRKRRAAKALKNKWREVKREVESEKKQKSWQSFAKKQKTVSQKDKSIFSTQGGTDTKVGVVTVAAGRQMTDFEERKRHKHT